MQKTDENIALGFLRLFVLVDGVELDLVGGARTQVLQGGRCLTTIKMLATVKSNIKPPKELEFPQNIYPCFRL